ncbi:MAG: AAA family ATPase [Desulfurococcaceae archaeon]
MKLLVCIVGMPGSGKSLLVKAAKEMGLKIITMGDIVREEVVKRGMRVSIEALLEVAQELRRLRGDNYIAVKTLEKLEEVGDDIVVIDGVRSLSELEKFKEKHRVVVVAVHASPLTRFKRLLMRGREGDPRNWEEFVKRDLVELSWGIGSVIALADYMVINEWSEEHAYKEAVKVIEEIVENARKSRSSS